MKWDNDKEVSFSKGLWLFIDKEFLFYFVILFFDEIGRIDEFINSISAAAIYSAMFNYFDFPSGAIIVTNETEEDQVQLEEYSEKDRLFYLAKTVY
ncbi:hypothetical protein Avbf_12607 [Armadillidium vulgare]|nr:hypothetical protein Avbf_12607 [Armadillidium vulgare]